MVARWRFLTLVGTLALSLVLPAVLADARKESKKVVSFAKADASLEHVDVFAGIEQGVLDVKLIPQDALSGNILIENKGEKPLNVDFPPAFIAKQVLKQFPGQQPGANAGGPGGGANGQANGGGGSQIQGGGIGQGNNGAAGNGVGLGNPGGGRRGNGNANGMGNGIGFFSVPADKIVRVPYRSVCLEHGKPDPSPRMTYRIGKVEEFSDDPVLVETLKIVAGGEHDPQAAQAAAWHVANKMSWKQLTEKSIPHIGRPATRYFSAETLDRAKKIHETSIIRAKELEAKSVAALDVKNESSSAKAGVKRD